MSIRNRNVPIPRLDRIDRKIRDKIFASESELNSFIINLQKEVGQAANMIDSASTTAQDKYELLESDIEYFQSRKEEIMSIDVHSLKVDIDETGKKYTTDAKKYKDIADSDFRFAADSLNYDQVILSKSKNHLEKYRTLDDRESSTKTLLKNDTDDQIQQYSRLNTDDFANTTFYNQVFLPFDNTEDEILLFSFKTLPVNYRDSNKENSFLGAFCVKFFLRSNELVGDFTIVPSENDTKYGVKIISEGLINLSEDYNLNLYYDNSTEQIHVTLSNAVSLNMEKESNSSSPIVNIGINILLGSDIVIPDNIQTKFNKNAKTLISHYTLSEEEGPVYGVLNDDNFYEGHGKIVLSADNKCGNTQLYRISTTKHDLSSDETTLLNHSSIQYNTGSGIKKDDTCEVLLKSLIELKLNPGFVYKAKGFVIINNLYFPIEQLKLAADSTPKTNALYSDMSEIYGVELLFDRKWEYDIEDFAINTSSSKVYPYANIKGTRGFPGIVIEGSETYDNTVGKNRPMRNAMYGSIINHTSNGDDKKSAIKLLFSTQSTDSTISSTAWGYDTFTDAKVVLNAFDLTIFISDNLHDNNNISIQDSMNLVIGS